MEWLLLKQAEGGELAALIAVEDLRLAVLGDGLFQSFHTKVRIHAV